MAVLRQDKDLSERRMREEREKTGWIFAVFSWSRIEAKEQVDASRLI